MKQIMYQPSAEAMVLQTTVIPTQPGSKEDMAMKSLRVEILKRSALPLCFAKNLSMAALAVKEAR